MGEPVELSVPFEVICINDLNKPREIPITKWLTKGKKYTVIGLGQTLDGKLGFKLKEIELGEDCYPYDCFNPNRFGLVVKEVTLQDELEALGIQVEEYDRELLEI